MGILTETMSRLRDEIVSASRSRQTFRGELVRQTEERRSQVSALCSAFARDRAGAHRAWHGRAPSAHATAKRESARREEQGWPAELARTKTRAAQHAPAPAARPPARQAKPPVGPAAPGTHAPKHPFKGSRQSGFLRRAK